MGRGVSDLSILAAAIPFLTQACLHGSHLLIRRDRGSKAGWWSFMSLTRLPFAQNLTV